MSKPVFYKDLNKRAEDLFLDDYTDNFRLSLKIKEIKGIVINAETCKIDADSKISKVTGVFSISDNIKVNELSLSTTGIMCGNIELNKVLKNTAFQLHCENNYYKNKLLKAEIETQYFPKHMAISCIADIISQQYSLSYVYAYKEIMGGIRIKGKGQAKPSCDLALSYDYDKLRFFCSGNNLFDTVTLSLYYKASKSTKIAATCQVKPGSNEVPDYLFGIKYKPTKDAIVRAKINEKAVISGSFKVNVNKKVSIRGSLSVDVLSVNLDNNKMGIGIDLIY